MCCDLLKTSAMPEIQAHSLSYVKPDNIGSDDQIFQAQYWNKTSG